MEIHVFLLAQTELSKMKSPDPAWSALLIVRLVIQTPTIADLVKLASSY